MKTFETIIILIFGLLFLSIIGTMMFPAHELYEYEIYDYENNTIQNRTAQRPTQNRTVQEPTQKPVQEHESESDRLERVLQNQRERAPQLLLDGYIHLNCPECGYPSPYTGPYEIISWSECKRCGYWFYALCPYYDRR